MKYIVSLLLAIILISIPKSVNAGEISKKDQKYIIGIHNIYRGSLRLKKLEWSADLASSAKNWAGMLENNECPLVHSPAEIRNNYGENLYAGWSSDSHYHISVRKGGYAWAKEKSYY